MEIDLINECNEPLRVLFFDFEQNPKQLYNRYPNYNEVFGDNFYLVTAIDEPFLNQEIIELYLDAINPQLLIIDNLSAIDVGDDITKPAVATQFIQMILRLRNKYNITVILVSHHTKASIGGLPEINHISGGKAITNLADTILQFGQINNTTFIRQNKSRFAEKDDKKLLLLKVERNDPTENLRINTMGWATERELNKP